MVVKYVFLEIGVGFVQIKRLRTIHCDALRDFVPFVQLKKLKNNHGAVCKPTTQNAKYYSHISIVRILLDLEDFNMSLHFSCFQKIQIARDCSYSHFKLLKSSIINFETKTILLKDCRQKKFYRGFIFVDFFKTSHEIHEN